MAVSALAPVYVVPSPPSDYYVYGPAYYEDYYYGPPDGLTDYGPPPRNWHGSSQNPHSKSPSPAPTLRTSKTTGLTSSQQKIDAKFKAARTKAKRAGVDALSQADIEAARASSNKSVDIKRRPS